MAIRRRAGASPVFPMQGRRFFSRRHHLVVVAGLLSACGRDAGPAAQLHDFVRDDGGRAVPLAPAPRRILPLAPSATELLIELGWAHLLVGRTAYDRDPRVSHLPDLGASLSPSVESVVALAPDLVITGSDVLTGGFPERLEALGLRVYEIDAQRVEDVLGTTRRLAALIGDEERGSALAASLARELQDLERDLSALPPTPLLYLVWHSPPLVAGRDTYVDDVVRAAGGRNVFGELPGWVGVSLEEVLARDPHVVIVPSADEHSLRPEWLTGSPLWRQVPAVRAGRLIVVDSDLFNRPGPRLVLAARTLAAALHPAPGPDVGRRERLR